KGRKVQNWLGSRRSVRGIPPQKNSAHSAGSASWRFPQRAFAPRSEEAALGAGGGARGGGAAEVIVGGAGGDPAARGAGEEAGLQEEGLDDVFEGAALLGQRGGDRLDADRAAVEA